MEEEYRLKYLKSGLFFAFALATTFLPILLGFCNTLVGLFGIVILTFINYIYIALLKDSRFRRFNPIILIPLNILLMLFSIPWLFSLPWEVEGMVIAFSMIFLGIPLSFFIIAAGMTHDKYCRDSQELPKGW
jgi:hypothetical protein